MANWSPSEIMSNLASSLGSSLRRIQRQGTREQLIRNALLAEDDQDELETKDISIINSRSGSPEIPMLDSPSVFTLALNGDENTDPNAILGQTRSRKRRVCSMDKNKENKVTMKGKR